jgi:hypothetical protein
MKAYALALPFTAAAAGETLYARAPTKFLFMGKVSIDFDRYRLQRSRSALGDAIAVLGEAAYVNARLRSRFVPLFTATHTTISAGTWWSARRKS